MTTHDSSNSPSQAVAPDNAAIERRQHRGWWQAPRRTVLVYLVLFIAAELIGAYVDITAQAYLTAGLAFFAANQAVFGYRTKRTAGLVMAALFASRLMTLTLPTAGISTPTRAALIGLSGCLVMYSAMWVLGYDIRTSRATEGFTLRRPFVNKGVTAALTVVSGVPIGFIAHQLIDPPALLIDPLLSSTTLPLVLAAGGLILGAFSEELLYRRLVAAMVQHTGQSQTPLVSGALYGATFIGTHDLRVIALMFAAGAFFAWSCERTGSLKPVVAAHAIASVLVFLVLP